MENKNSLTDKQLRTITVILETRTYEEAIEKAKISRGTFYDWLKEEPFKAELARQRAEITDEALDTLKGACSEAVNELRSLIKDNSPSIRLRASQAIIDYNFKVKEIEDIEQRVEKIEKSLEGRGR